MKLRLPLLLRLALLSTAAAYTLGSGCLFADDAPADATEQDDPIAEAVEDDDAALMPTIGFEGYTESQLVDIQSSDAVGAVIHGVLENSTTGAVANVGTTSSTSNGATSAAESPALTLSAPAEPATDSALTTSTLSDSAAEGAVAPFFSAEEAAALVVASPATSTPLIKNASTATLTSSDASDETTSSAVANGASSSIGSVGTASAGGAGASPGGGSASYSLTSSAPDSSSTSLVITTPTDDSIAEEVLEDSTTEETTTLPDSSASTSSATTRTIPPLKLLGATSETSTKGTVKVDGVDRPSSVTGSDNNKGVQFLYGTLGKDGSTENIIYLHANQPTYPSVVEVDAGSFYICPAGANPKFDIGTLKTATSDAIVKIQNNEWSENYSSSLILTLGALSVNGSASLDVSKTQTGAISVSIGKVVNSSTESTTGPLLTSVTNSGTLTLGTNASGEGASKVTASSVSIGTLTNDGTMELNGVTTITNNLTNTGTLTVNSGATLVGTINSTGILNLNGEWDLSNTSSSKVGTLKTYLDLISAESSGNIKLKASGTDASVLNASLSTNGVSLTFVGNEVMEINSYAQKNSSLTVSAGSKLSTEGDLRIENTAKLVVEGEVTTKGALQLGHQEGADYAGYVELKGNGRIISTCVAQTPLRTDRDFKLTKVSEFSMTGGVLTLTQGYNGEKESFSGVSAAISSGVLDISRSSWGIDGEGDGVSVKVGGVVVSDVYEDANGNSVSDSHTLTLKNSEITGDITLDGKAGLILKDVTVTGESVTLGGDARTVQVASGGLTVANSVTTKGNLEVATGNELVVKGTYATSGADSSLKLQGAATASLQNGETVVATVSQNSTEADASATITGGVTMKYDSDNDKAVIAGAGSDKIATLENAAVNLSSGGMLEVSNIGLSEGSELLVKSEDATVTTITNKTGSTANITGSLSMKYQVAQDTTPAKAIISGAGDSPATITNSLLTVASGSTLSLQNVILAGNTKISVGTAAAAAVALLDEGSGESASAVTTVNLSGSVIQLSQDNATPDNETNPVGNLTKGATLTKTGPAGGEGDTLTIQQDSAKVYTIDYTGATGVTLTGELTFDFDTFTVADRTGSGYYLLNELLKEYDYVALRFAGEGVSVDPEVVAVTSKVTMGTNTVTSAGYVANDTATSGVVVYFDAMALPEPTTSTLGLLALAALCARRRRSRTRAHAEHA